MTGSGGEPVATGSASAVPAAAATAAADGTDSVSLWPPESAGRPVVFLADLRRPFEAEILRRRIERAKPGDRSAGWRLVPISDRSGGASQALRSALGEEVWLQPVRLFWRPAGEGRSGLWGEIREALSGNPGRRRGRRLARREPERAQVLVGAGALRSEVEERYHSVWDARQEHATLADFVARQALVVLERAERAARGARYKVPRLLPRDVFSNRRFRDQLEAIAEREGVSLHKVDARAARYLREMAATQTPLTLDVVMAVQQAMTRANHDPVIDVVEEQMETVRQLVRSRPVAFVMTHKSMLDSMALQCVLWRRNLPMPLTFGGINMNTPGIGALARRAGVIFLRRSFQDNAVYKATFRRYIDYLIEKRFSLLWALEGTRSRTGKLLPPRYGLFNYVVQAILRTHVFDVTFVPVNITYDQITEVADYASEQLGRDKKPEGAGWFVRFLRGGAPHGRIFLRFGAPLTLPDLVPLERLEEGLDEAGQQAAVQRLAFETAVRMNGVTPITPTAIVTLILLASDARAQSLRSIQHPARAGMALVRRRRLEVVGRTDFKRDEALREVLEQLIATGVVTRYDEGEEPLYGIAEAQHLKAAYYRNTIIHFFVVDALIELSLLQAAGRDEAAFWAEMLRLRDLFKHEFYFRRRDEFRRYAESLLTQRFPRWRERLPEGAEAVRGMLSGVDPLLSHAVLRSFVDAYWVVARRLGQLDGAAVGDRKEFVRDCLRLGRQLRLEGRIFSEESVSRSLYETALKVAEGRGLLGDESGADPAARRVFVEQLRSLGRRLDEVLSLGRAPAD